MCLSKEDFFELAKILLDKHHSCQSLGLSRQQAAAALPCALAPPTSAAETERAAELVSTAITELRRR